MAKWIDGRMNKCWTHNKRRAHGQMGRWAEDGRTDRDGSIHAREGMYGCMGPWACAHADAKNQ
eukprot:11202723-Lingulodinium_polyedra.AAC.1